MSRPGMSPGMPPPMGMSTPMDRKRTTDSRAAQHLKAKKKKVADKILPQRVRDLVPESQAYMDLLAFERKLDATITRKRLDTQEALKRPMKQKRKLRIFISNTFYPAKLAEGDDGEEQVTFWELRIKGRLLEDSSSDISTRSENNDPVSRRHARGRGARPRRSGVRGRGGRSRGRGGRGRSRSPINQPTLEERKDSLKTEISSLTRDEMAEVLLRVVEVDPGVLFYVLRPSSRPGGGYHPDPSNPSPGWCTCGYCREMPTDPERLCCHKQHCVSRTQRFETLILDEGVLAMGRLLRRDILVYPDEDLGEDGDDINKANRFYAYTQFTLWVHGRLGAGNRVPIPSCCVWRIRDKFPNPYGQYVGFIPARV